MAEKTTTGRTRKTATPAQNVSDAEKAASRQMPAPYVNKSVAAASDNLVRLTFLESHSGFPAHARAAVTMTMEQMLKLRDMLNLIEAKHRPVTSKDA